MGAAGTVGATRIIPKPQFCLMLELPATEFWRKSLASMVESYGPDGSWVFLTTGRASRAVHADSKIV